tara:strand:- start:259 stop:546 length:288 start_codon:yes stop_codon:yes gene_type:complete
MSDLECPYCGADVEINHDDGFGYSEDELHEQLCWRCDKAFVFTTSIHFHYSPQKADCLNGGAHKYERTKTYPPKYAKLECRDCGDQQPLPEPPND